MAEVPHMTSPTPIILSAVEVARHFPGFNALYEALRRTMRDYSMTDKIVLPIRTQINVPGSTTRFITMPTCDVTLGLTGLKIVTAAPDNAHLGLPTHLGSILLYELSGQLLSQMDCEEITGKRTAVCSAVATRILANPDSRILAVLGAGVQAETHVWALRHLYQFSEIRIWNRTHHRAVTLAEKLGHCTPLKTIEDACRDADIICATTGSRDPILERRHVKPGAHINLVGSSTPVSREAASDIMTSSDVTLVVDCKQAIAAESGDFILAGAAPHYEIGELIDSGFPRSDSDITVYKNLGLGCQDLTAASLVLKNYQESN